MPVIIEDKRTATQLRIEAKQEVDRTDMGGQKTHQVVLVMDVSPSMETLFRKRASGMSPIEAFLPRVLSLGVELDDNGVIPCYLLDQGVRKGKDITLDNIDGYVNYLHANIGSGTSYAPSIDQVVRDAQPGDPMLVLFCTDGENFDETPAEKAIIAASASPIFFQFFGIHGEGKPPRFPFLEELDTMQGRIIDNAGFSTLGLTTITNEELYKKMLVEYPDFLRKARAMGMLPWTRKPQIEQRRGLFGMGRR